MAEEKKKIETDVNVKINDFDVKTDDSPIKIEPNEKVIDSSNSEPLVKKWDTNGGSQSISSGNEVERNTAMGYKQPNAPLNETYPSSSLPRNSLDKPQNAVDSGKREEESDKSSIPSYPAMPVNEPSSVPASSNAPATNSGGANTNGDALAPNPVNNVPEPSNPDADSLPKRDGLEGNEKDKKDGSDGNQDQGKKDDPNGNQGQGKKEESGGEQEESDKSKTADQVPTTNGKTKNAPYDPTENARRNMEHNNRVQGDEGRGVANNPTNNTKPNVRNNQTGLTNPFMGLGNRLRNGINNGFNRLKNNLGNGLRRNDNQESDSSGKNPDISKKVMAAIASVVKKHPAAFAIGAIILIIIFTVVGFEATSSSNSSTHCRYSLSGVSSTGNIDLDSVQVELVNCDATPENYEVLETVDFEKYVLGVALAEIGPDSPDEAIKAQIVAARGFALTRNSGMCPGNPDDCFYGYNSSTNKIRMRACEADQVYWDYEKDIYRQDRGSISLYSPEVTSGTLWKSALNEARKEEVLALAEDVKGKVLLDDNGDVVSTNYVASDSSDFISLANEGKTYDEILLTHYEEDGAASFNSAVCTNGGNIDYGDYVLDSDGSTILNQRLDTFLESQGTSLEEFNALIEQNVEKNGYGTKAGVVAAAVTLIAELSNNYGVKVPYYWGGGHYDGVVVGALGKWGSSECNTSANGQVYDKCGLDCSGFVPWAIKNGGFDIAQNLAGDFQYLSGAQRVTLSSSQAVVEPGDILESDSHVVLVVGIDEENKQYICAEASGYSSGVQFTRRAFGSSGYWGVNMDGYYANHVRSS